MLSLLWFLVFHISSYYLSISVADLYPVDQARTLCYSDVAEFVCSQYDTLITWTITSSSSDMSDQISFHTLFDPVRMKNGTIDSTLVTAQLIVGNISFIMSKLTIAANLLATIECDEERISYQPLNSKFYYNGDQIHCIQFLREWLNLLIIFLISLLSCNNKDTYPD